MLKSKSSTLVSTSLIMSDFASNYGSSLSYSPLYYFNYDMLKKRIYEIEDNKVQGGGNWVVSKGVMM